MNSPALKVSLCNNQCRFHNRSKCTPINTTVTLININVCDQIRQLLSDFYVSLIILGSTSNLHQLMTSFRYEIIKRGKTSLRGSLCPNIWGKAGQKCSNKNSNFYKIDTFTQTGIKNNERYIPKDISDV